MKILFVDTYYPGFIKNIRNKYPNLNKKSYTNQLNFLLNQFFGTADFLSFNLKKMGWKASDIIVNDEILQKKWAKENKIKVNGNFIISKIQMLPLAYKFLGKPKWIQQIALEQIKRYKPDIVYSHDLSILNPDTLTKVKKYCKLLVGQIASPPPPENYLKKFDLIITSFPHYVKMFKKLGVDSEYLRLAFEPRVLPKFKNTKRVFDISFVGSFTPHHQKGTKLLEKLACDLPIHIWGQGLRFLSPFSPLRKYYHGEAWGMDMFKVLAQSKIVINRHIGAAKGYTNNMRLYETTGMGAMLITDRKKNLKKIFDVGKEVIDYKDVCDLKQKINYYLQNDLEREKIARAGQKRILKEHNYPNRVKELSGILKKYIHGR